MPTAKTKKTATNVRSSTADPSRRSAKPSAKPAKAAAAAGDREPPESVSPAIPHLEALAEQAYTLEQLLARIKKAGALPTESDVRSMVALTDTALAEIGSEVATSRIDTDCARLYGQALDFLTQASPAQRDALLGLTDGYLHCAIFAAHRGQALNAELLRSGAASASLQKQRETAAQLMRNAAIARRAQLRSVLERLSGGEATRKAEIAGAFGRMGTPEDLADSLAALCALGRRYLKDKDPGIGARRKLIGLSEDVLTASAELATQVRTTGRAGQAVRGRSAVSQGDVDLWDGINLTLLDQIIQTFAAGNAANPTVPRLFPLALSRWFSARPKKKPAEPASPSPTPAPA